MTRAYRCAWWGCTTPAPAAGRLCPRHMRQRIIAAARPGPLRRRLLRHQAARPTVQLVQGSLWAA